MITRIPRRAIPRSATLRAICQPLRQASRIANILPTAVSTQSRRLQHKAQHPRASYSTLPSTAEAPRPADLRSQFSTSPEAPFAQPKPKKSFRGQIYATIFLSVGLLTGAYIRFLLAPPPLPAVDSKEDQFMVESLHKKAEKLPIVQSLSTDPNWVSYEAYSSLPSAERPHRLTTGPLGGARALGGFQRIFYHKESGEIVSVVWFGGAIAGWPGVMHGGVTATIMDESLGRCALRQFPSHTGVTANLELKYLKPIVTNNFYVVRAMPEAGGTERKGWVTGRLETLEGRVCVEAKALFVVPKKFKMRAIAENF